MVYNVWDNIYIYNEGLKYTLWKTSFYKNILNSQRNTTHIWRMF